MGAHVSVVSQSPTARRGTHTQSYMICTTAAPTKQALSAAGTKRAVMIKVRTMILAVLMFVAGLGLTYWGWHREASLALGILLLLGSIPMLLLAIKQWRQRIPGTKDD